MQQARRHQQSPRRHELGVVRGSGRWPGIVVQGHGHQQRPFQAPSATKRPIWVALGGGPTAWPRVAGGSRPAWAESTIAYRPPPADRAPRKKYMGCAGGQRPPRPGPSAGSPSAWPDRAAGGGQEAAPGLCREPPKAQDHELHGRSSWMRASGSCQDLGKEQWGPSLLLRLPPAFLARPLLPLHCPTLGMQRFLPNPVFPTLISCSRRSSRKSRHSEPQSPSLLASCTHCISRHPRGSLHPLPSSSYPAF